MPYQSLYQSLPYQPPSSTSATNAISISSIPRPVQTQPNVVTTSQATSSNTRHLVAPTFIRPLEPPYPRWYDVNATCTYHSGATGHDLENCTAFKYKVQALVDNGKIQFNVNDEPSVSSNPLPEHGKGAVNAANVD
ncbi:hypothetical protein PTKIN_Ptkin07bG0240600 [Pterospermum kingtungense]